jgi:hypothetical protein
VDLCHGQEKERWLVSHVGNTSGSSAGNSHGTAGPMSEPLQPRCRSLFFFNHRVFFPIVFKLSTSLFDIFIKIVNIKLVPDVLPGAPGMCKPSRNHPNVQALYALGGA